jgi:ABC-type nitrate/sulfonate/bicarbonate transport system ATPase subunit
MNHIRESDWKLLRRLQPIALDRFCQSVLSEVQATCSDAAATAHERYLQVFGLIQDQNKKMARIFDGMRRSTAVYAVTLMRTSGLITDEEFAEFSEELREMIQRYQGI